MEATAKTREDPPAPDSQESPPGKMQASIVQRLLMSGSERQQENKNLERFAKAVTEDFTERVKDRIYHKLEVEHQEAASSRYPEFVSKCRATDMAAVLMDEAGKPQIIIHFPLEFPNMLAPLYFGGDPAKPSASPGAEPTAAEIGMLNLFTGLVAKTLTRKTSGRFTLAAIGPFAELDRDELPGFGGAMIRLNMGFGENRQSFAFVIPESLVSEASERKTSSTGEIGHVSGDEVVHSKVKATVRLAGRKSSLASLRSMAVGDWLPLADDNLDAKLVVRGREIMIGQIGRTGDIYSFRAIRAVSPDGTGIAGVSATS